MSSAQPDKDLFENSRMSFGEHLEELRKVLVRSCFGIAIGCIFGLIFATQAVEFLTTPLNNAIRDFHIKQAEQRLIEKNGYLDPETTPWLKNEGMAPETVYVDPGEIVRMLRSVSPDFLSDIDLNPYGFLPGHFFPEKIPELCKRLSEPQESSLDASRLEWMWSQLTNEEKSVVRALAIKETATAQDVDKLVPVFDRICQLRSLSDEAAFAEKLTNSSSGFLEWLLASGKENPLVKVKAELDERFDEDLNRRLNRVLITSLFADLMPEVRKDMVPLQMWTRVAVEPQSLTAIEPFMIWLKAVFILGLVIASPWVFFQLWSFVAAGLYPHEQRYIYVFLPISMALFFSGVCLAFFFVFEPVLTFLFTFNAQMGIVPQPRVTEWMNFVMFLPVGFGIAFQLPLVMLFLNRIGVFQVKDYLSKWRIAIMVIFVISMLLTPADPISMILLAAPLSLLYFLGIALCQWMPKSRNPFENPDGTVSVPAE